MFRAVLFTQWLSSRLLLASCMIAAFTIPILAVQGAVGGQPQQWQVVELLASVRSIGTLLPILAAGDGSRARRRRVGRRPPRRTRVCPVAADPPASLRTASIWCGRGPTVADGIPVDADDHPIGTRVIGHRFGRHDVPDNGSHIAAEAGTHGSARPHIDITRPGPMTGPDHSSPFHPFAHEHLRTAPRWGQRDICRVLGGDVGGERS